MWQEGHTPSLSCCSSFDVSIFVPISAQRGRYTPSSLCHSDFDAVRRCETLLGVSLSHVNTAGRTGPSLLCSYHFDMVRKGPLCFNSSSQFYFITNNLSTPFPSPSLTGYTMTMTVPVGISEFGSLGISTPHLVMVLFGLFLVYTVAIFVVIPHSFVTLHYHDFVHPHLGVNFPQCLLLLFPNMSKVLSRAFDVSEPAEMLRNTKDISLWVCFSCFKGIYSNPWSPAWKQASVGGMFSCSRVLSPPMPWNDKNLPNLCNGCGFGMGPVPVPVIPYTYIVIHCYQTHTWTCEPCQNLESDYHI